MVALANALNVDWLTQIAPEVAGAVVEDGGWLQKQFGAAPDGLVAMQSAQLVGESQTDCAEHRARSTDRRKKRCILLAAEGVGGGAWGRRQERKAARESRRKKEEGEAIRRIETTRGNQKMRPNETCMAPHRA